MKPQGEKKSECNNLERSAKLKRISWTCFGQDLTYLHVDTADKLVLKLLQYAGNYSGELLQQAKISQSFGSDNISVGRYQRSEPGNSVAPCVSSLEETTLALKKKNLHSFHFYSFPPLVIIPNHIDYPSVSVILAACWFFCDGLLTSTGSFSSLSHCHVNRQEWIKTEQAENKRRPGTTKCPNKCYVRLHCFIYLKPHCVLTLYLRVYLPTLEGL